MFFESWFTDETSNMKWDYYSDQEVAIKWNWIFCNLSLMNNAYASHLTLLHHYSSWIIYFSLHSSNREQRIQPRFWEKYPVHCAQYSRWWLQNCSHREPQSLPVKVSVIKLMTRYQRVKYLLCWDSNNTLQETAQLGMFIDHVLVRIANQNPT